MYTKNVHDGNVIHTVYTICIQKVYYSLIHLQFLQASDAKLA